MRFKFRAVRLPLVALLFGSLQLLAQDGLLAPTAASSLLAPLEVTDAQPFYVTSDGSGTHTTSPGVSVFGLNHDGVCDIIVTIPGVGSFRGTGTLLPGGNAILTAAHVITNAGSFVPGTTATVTFKLSSGNTTIGVDTFTVHPSYNGNYTEGYDLAVLELVSTAPASVPRYDIYRGTTDVGNPGPQIKVGFGMSGHGATGATLASGTKRAGLNEYEMDGRATLSALGGGSNPFGGSLPAAGATSAYDFDSGLAANDVFAYSPFNLPANLGFGADEVGAAPGDSGGPTFQEANDTRLTLPAGPVNLGSFIVGTPGNGSVELTKAGNNATTFAIDYAGDATNADTTGSFSGSTPDFKIAGVTSYGFGFIGLPDATPGGTHSSWGEVVVDMRVAYSEHASFIDPFLPADYKPLASQLLPITLDTSTPGPKSATLTVDNLAGTAEFANSGSNDPNAMILVTALALASSEASFSGIGNLDSLTLDFGTVLAGTPVASQAFSIFNLETFLGYTAALDLLAITPAGDTATLSTNLGLFDSLTAGDTLGFLAFFNTASPGIFEATYTLSVADDAAVSGAAAGTSLFLRLTGQVVLIPEPAALTLLLAGLFATTLRRPRRS